ncbi:class I poly(R)-hydroxyalkanoic acid synthase [Shewanella psychropiezotolerans]|uniref:Class I poly(R)-hydroxyalkanoic acid synthase n=1 Tax=Shewanella psychropiezotolerans TaxID=2593655 RepID=A0ABX5X491_9GAMM|nr:class I poly(R)-hydroxyalkanoic acid synthase [Shewanella psychropiezotolerans]QDO86056.1 class I poly(R)-hydroxyalkanoic acid synthase [Shewanella psychropiezotolerans]
MTNQSPFHHVFDQLLKMNQQFLQPLQSQSPTQKALLENQTQDFASLMQSFSNQPMTHLEQQMQWWQQQMELFNTCVTGACSDQTDTDKKADRRFSDPAWSENAFHNYIKQSYLLTCKNIEASIASADDLDDPTRHRLEFFTRQFLNAMAPTNFVMTNPEILKLTLETNGENLARGFEQLAKDLSQSADTLNIRMTDEKAFILGENIAATPGKVVFQNELFELIQYQPTTDTVYKRPLLIVPPFVNKYYIMDLRESRSYIRWLAAQGHTVFCMSWTNPNAEMAATGFENYVLQGVIPALDAIEKQTGEREVNGIGYCIGGTLLTTTMAYMAAKRTKQRIKSATLLTTMLDFSHPGELGVFISDQMISAIEAQNNIKGYMDGRQMAVSFSLLRENALYWNYYITNYLKGESPMAFDLLFWNSDNTNITAACHNQMLRQFYLNNELCEKGKFKVGNVAIDLQKVNAPVYFMSAIEDHIALWQGTYQGNHLLGGDSTFVLGESGHIAGPMNHPDAQKYGFWTNADTKLDARDWLSTADKHDGSWWQHWQTWADERNFGERIEPRTLQGELDAPGTYVKQRIADVIQATKEEVSHED